MRMKKIFRYDSGIHIRLRDNEDGSETIEVTFDDRFNWNDDVVSGRIPLDEDSGLLDWITRFDEQAQRNGWEFDYDIAKDIESPIDGGANNDYLAMLTLTCKCDEKEDIFESNHTELIPREKRKSSEKFNRFFKKLYAMNNGDDDKHHDRATRMEHPYDNVSVIFVDMLEIGHEDEPEVEPHLRKVRSYIIKTAEENGWKWTYERFGMSIEFIITEDLDEEQLSESSTKYDESAMPLKGDQETGTMARVNDLVSKAYANLYDELKKAGIDFDAASDDGFYVNDPDAQKTYFINLYVNECQEYEGSYK